MQEADPRPVGSPFALAVVAVVLRRDAPPVAPIHIGHIEVTLADIALQVEVLDREQHLGPVRGNPGIGNPTDLPEGFRGEQARDLAVLF